MSHIDSYKHRLVGSFIGLPVYWPLEDVHGHPDFREDFDCTTRQLVIGGGSGEHPGLVITDPQAAVAAFLDDSLDDLDLPPPDADALRTILKPFLPFHPSRLVDFNRWDLRTCHAFHERCHSPYAENSYGMYEDRMGLEAWIALGFGEFVFFALPQLAPELVPQLPADLRRRFRHVRYNNVLLIPPGMPVYANGGNVFFSPGR